jgi:hypothetical protein
MVDSATLERDGYIAIHSTPLVPEGGSPQDSVIGVSAYLDAGTYADFEVELFDVPGLNADQSELKNDQRLIAMPHEETNGNQAYNFLTSNGQEDIPYFVNGDPNDGPVIDDGFVTVENNDGGYGDNREDDDRKYEDSEQEYENDRNDDGYEDDDYGNNGGYGNNSDDASANASASADADTSNTSSFDDLFAIFTSDY